jgi:hypothetical protein
MEVEGNRSPKPTSIEFWRHEPVHTLDDGAVEAAAQAAFEWYHRAVAANVLLDLTTIERLVTLQHEYLRRFPTGDLSASVLPRTTSVPRERSPEG